MQRFQYQMLPLSNHSCTILSLKEVITSNTTSLYICSPNAKKFLDLLLHHADYLECGSPHITITLYVLDSFSQLCALQHSIQQDNVQGNRYSTYKSDTVVRGLVVLAIGPRKGAYSYTLQISSYA